MTKSDFLISECLPAPKLITFLHKQGPVCLFSSLLPLTGLSEAGFSLLEIALIKLWRVEMGALMPVLTFDLHRVFSVSGMCVADGFRDSCHLPLSSFILLDFTTIFFSGWLL